MITRRRFTQGTAAAVIGCGFSTGPTLIHAAPGLSGQLASDITKIEAESGGRLGVAVLDTRSETQFGHRADERFPMCSTFKLLAAAAILSRVDAGKERLDRAIRFAAGDVVVYSPVTKDRIGGAGMSLEEICDAAMTASDNTAGNLLLASLDGPAGLTAYARSLGDTVTRLDRNEPDLNEALPGDPRDTTTPAAMASNIRTLLFDNTLSAGSKERLTAWLVGNKTGDTRLRAGLPKDWRVGDKTGAGEQGTTNDVGVVWPPGRAPVIIASYLTGTSAPTQQRNMTLAAVARSVASVLDH